ncbi:hypothetical protein ACWT_5267 [Actinoplanes sp. SE50]|uniref:hypothetical protein n=1 Tax=unclassified Actinoplanes TaxID=2626549 RepID=UPI00023EBDB9|nr:MULTISPECIES: hypothetical protein [unclassified Actinoplanes]AEV86285.1 hypothetical protein ACPL_5398 [Actinoplanes sp. SE50/110]ATO84682.1 hypothetical protein ACWT_5267 [Actinoplanes sp. SE50]SLM02092.1 hypothetical protein ACSP50_5330 [Actinoplanes sp. SE50/110]
MPHVEVSAGTIVTILGLLVLVAQPGAIPFAYAVTTRHVRRGGTRPTLAAIVGYLLGCLFTLVCVATFACSDFPWLWAALLGYVPMWLFSVLILRQPEISPGPVVRTGPDGR